MCSSLFPSLVHSWLRNSLHLIAEIWWWAQREKVGMCYLSSDIAGVQATGKAAKADRIWKESAEDLQAELFKAGVELWQVQLWPSGKVTQPQKTFVTCCWFRMRSQLNWVQKGRILYGNETDVNEYPWQVLIYFINPDPILSTNHKLYWNQTKKRINQAVRVNRPEPLLVCFAIEIKNWFLR